MGDEENVREEGETSGDNDDDDDMSNLFVIDSAPAVSKDNFGVPAYEKKFCEVLTKDKGPDTAKEPSKAKAPQNLCWNCQGNHGLRECTERKDYEAIARNRQIFMSKQGPRNPRQSRYHLDDEQKFSHIRAGCISNKLRRALGLAPDQLPRHIYRMRELGYPPGWIEEAKVSHSGLVLFDSEGQEVADPGFEAGEIAPQGAKDKYDVRQIIEYPGFNCPPAPGVIDEHQRLNAPPMSEFQSIERMISSWQPVAVKSYKRKRMSTTDPTTTPGTPKTRSLLLLDDMDIALEGPDKNDDEDGEVNEQDDHCKSIPPPPASVPQLELPLPSPPPSSTNKRPSSTSYELQEIKKQKLDKVMVDGSSSGENECEKECSSISVAEERENENEITNHCTHTPQLGRVKSVALGTPVIITSKYTNLPTPDKFSRNICDVINFENLPDSTGKYEKMSGLIKKVRTHVSKMSKDDDSE